MLFNDDPLHIAPPKPITSSDYPAMGSMEEKHLFGLLKDDLVRQFASAFPNKLAPKTVVIIPSLTLDQEILEKIDGIVHYEERLLCLLMLLRMPRTHVIYVTSVPLDPIVVDYYLHLLPGITGYHARQRLTLLSCYDASPVSLTQKILARPRLIERIRQHIPIHHAAHMACFIATPLERSLAIRLHIPIYGCDPDLFSLGNKSNGRQLFRQCGMQVPHGFENLHTELEIATALLTLKMSHPALSKAVVKMNEGFSGEGNAVFSFHGLDGDTLTLEKIRQSLPGGLAIVARNLPYAAFIEKFEDMGGVVEAFMEGTLVTSPSVQCRIDPSGHCDIISTHDQVLGGDDSQVFLGAHFPANTAYAGDLARLAMPLCELLREKGVIGRFGVDFLSIKNAEEKWTHYAIEINMRKGGTTHPYQMMNFLTDGRYDADTGIYTIKTGQPRCYFSTDNLVHECYRGLTPHDLIEIAMDNDLMFNGASQEGVMFHMIGALSQYGKLGVVSIGKTKESAYGYYGRTKEVLLRSCQ
jgi:hypothetical protein